MRHDIDWSKSHCGVMLCTYKETVELMPEVKPILDDLATESTLHWDGDYHLFWDGKLIDVKVHMLMPGQYPCIPNWHRDFTPRGEDGERLANFRTPVGDPAMYMWLSEAPLTQYRDRNAEKEPAVVYEKPAQEWHTFFRGDVHRGQAAKDHVWRCFIRVIPECFVHGTTINAGTVRRHCQVYLDADNFRW